ncbi:ROK family transcriptional regulator [Photobacterium sanguinicancri]|uniref:ROK family transcriptional regulator n=1 Tax=Photobacterium sanguinicancri TaxID=875932 RepID=A0AAW7Y914_9GAMM|nr:ROK family transcriptional regulator [Photobacterium sanguinicancri]MDO6544726.1 ROK family transcriptional regulator [Photobacterium sanguinicancri]
MMTNTLGFNGHKGLNNQQVRQYNCRIIMALLYKNKGMTKSQLAQATQLSIPAITKIIDALIEQGRVENTVSPHVSKGNFKGLYNVSCHRPDTICLNVSPTRIQAIMVDNEITPCSAFINQAIAPDTPEALIDDIVAVIVACRQVNRTTPYRLSIAVHGQVDTHVGSSMRMPQAPWTQAIELKYILEQRLHVDVLVDNDCVMMALAEKWLGGHSGQDFCVLNIDYGIGSSFLINNNIYRGKMFGSGQIGHTKVANNGIICGCGREGCLETEASSKALCERYSQHSSLHRHNKTTRKNESAHFPQTREIKIEKGQTLAFDDFVLRYQQHDPIALDVAHRAATVLGQALYNFLITLNINKIILYGNTCALGQPWLNTITDQTLTNPFEDKNARRQDQTLVSFGQLSQIERVMGMSYLWVEQELDSLFLA